MVGTKIATWNPFSTTLNADRSATSVFPNPTSPQSSLSIGVFDFKSLVISFIDLS